MRSLDCVLSAGEAILAVTRTDVCTVPELTTVCTVPSEADMADAGARLRPPTVESRENDTVAPALGAPVVSVTVKITTEVAARPVPLRPIELGLADVNCIEPIADAVTDTVPVAKIF